jgi:hypothetical protein
MACQSIGTYIFHSGQAHGCLFFVIGVFPTTYIMDTQTSADAGW